MQQATSDYIQRVEKEMNSAILTKTNKQSGTLSSSVSGSFSPQQAVLKFADYGRFLDMGVSKGHPLGGQKTLANNLKSKSKNIRRRKIYSTIAYGNLNGLIGDLAYGFTDEAVELIKAQLKQ